ncbi:MAG: amino acid adenylation domain-containing protein, partial [bacterium]|nr:amino acid adenylation domain-containing protein [bacterium]
PIAGRRHSDLQHIIGMFVNTLTLRNFPEAHKPFRSFLEEVKSRGLEAFENQEYPFEDLVDHLIVERDISRNPLFDVMFQLQDPENGPAETPDSPELKDGETTADLLESNKPGKDCISKFDMTLIAKEVAQCFTFTFEYSTKLFKRPTIARFARYFKTLALSATTNPALSIDELELLTAAEKQEILLNFNRKSSFTPGYPKAHLRFEEFAAQNPHKTAVSAIEGTKRHTLTYSRLDREAARSAALLRSKGIKPGDVVALMMERSPDMIIAIMAIFKTGAVYLPISPDSPTERIRYMLLDSCAGLLITTSQTPEKYNIIQQEIAVSDILFTDDPIDIGDTTETTDTADSKDTQRPNIGEYKTEDFGTTEAPAYIIYTSGSTGLPKGVLVNHRSMMNMLQYQQREYPLVESDVYLFKTSTMFDVSITELFGWYQGGGSLAVLEPGGEKDPQVILEAIKREAVTHINFVPSMFTVFVNEPAATATSALVSLKYIFLAGEAIMPDSIRKFRRYAGNVSLENLYGPTEATVYAARYSIADWNGEGRIPIGKPLENLQLHIIAGNDTPRLQPVGIPGELTISGVGPAVGYLNNPQYTSEKFIPNPFTTNPEATDNRMYRTGDLARWLPDGNIEFLGRIDHQVKIRGFRIELGEIENRLLKTPGVREAVVVDREINKDRQICAYIIANDHVDTEKLPSMLAAFLPQYMIPAHFIQLESIPLSGSGKLNRNALPLPTLQSAAQYIPPQTDEEKLLVEVWSQILTVPAEHIGIHHNFFHMGGHSLKATALTAQIHQRTGAKVPLIEIFKRPTIKQLALYIHEAAHGTYRAIAAAEKKDLYPASSSQKRLYLLQQMDKEGIGYNMPFITPLDTDIQKERLESTFQQLIKRHESLRTCFQVKDGIPVQEIKETVDFSVAYFDLAIPTQKGKALPGEANPGAKEIPAGQMEKQRIQDILSTFVRPFDLSRAPLMRVGLIHIPSHGEDPAAGKYVLMLDMHHIIT